MTRKGALSDVPMWLVAVMFAVMFLAVLLVGAGTYQTEGHNLFGMVQDFVSIGDQYTNPQPAQTGQGSGGFPSGDFKGCGG